MIDFHSHFLPKMDDGSSSVEESIEMLQTSFSQGIDTMVGTSHFYAFKESPDSFLQRREKALSRLPTEIENAPRILLGAEVYYFDGMSHTDDLKRLTLQGTDYILVEMPFVPWSSNMVSEVLKIRDRLHLKPYMAHIERYIKFNKKNDYIEELMREGLIIQSNASFFLNFSTGHKALKMLKNNEIQLLGSDTHNMSSRKPDLGPALEKIEKKLGSEVLERVDRLGRHMLRDLENV